MFNFILAFFIGCDLSFIAQGTATTMTWVGLSFCTVSLVGRMVVELFDKGTPPTKEWAEFVLSQVIERCAHEADRFVAGPSGIPNAIASNIRKLAPTDSTPGRKRRGRGR